MSKVTITVQHGIKRWDVLQVSSWGKGLVVKVKENNGAVDLTIIPLRKASKYKIINKLYRLWLKIKYFF